MKDTYLIQRLLPPFENPKPKLEALTEAFSFGGGLQNGGLSEEAMNLLRPLFRFDYMGAAEYEFGAVPKALSKMFENRGKYKKFVLMVPRAMIKKLPWRERDHKEKTGSAKVYVFCEAEDWPEVEKRLTALITNELGSKTPRLKEGMNSYVFKYEPVKDPSYPRTFAWLEIDNGFFFTEDGEAFVKFTKLFEV